MLPRRGSAVSKTEGSASARNVKNLNSSTHSLQVIYDDCTCYLLKINSSNKGTAVTVSAQESYNLILFLDTATKFIYVYLLLYYDFYLLMMKYNV